MLNEQRAQLGLHAEGEVIACNPRWPQLCLQPAEFEYPRDHLPACFHFTGPLTDVSARIAVAFPWEKLDGRRLVYASLGTMQNRRKHLFVRIARACAALDVQLVMSLGGGCEPGDLGVLPGSPVVVPFAPQLELLKRASLCITHGGMNTTMECLAEGVPMVAIPITNDQPGVAARIAWTGCGEWLHPHGLSVRRLRSLVRKVLEGPGYRQSAQRMRVAILRAGGLKRAADIVEQITSVARAVA
jgi:MGT family glycosyltransferase